MAKKEKVVINNKGEELREGDKIVVNGRYGTIEKLQPKKMRIKNKWYDLEAPEEGCLIRFAKTRKVEWEHYKYCEHYTHDRYLGIFD